MEMLGFPVVSKYVRHAARTSAIFRLCLTKFMREMLRSLSRKVIICTNSNINGKYALPDDRKDIKVCFGDEK